MGPADTSPEYVPANLLEVVPTSGKHVEFMTEAMGMGADYPYTGESWAFLKEVFADGEVTRSEYERAVSPRRIACVSSAIKSRVPCRERRL
ncbi:MAG TPA: hypothetical protein VKZ47_10085 [Acidimicrobiia bacterium]|nr:hypothetical protein [Acidimicrobiia bacterium]